jgi:hypothetical protein
MTKKLLAAIFPENFFLEIRKKILKNSEKFNGSFRSKKFKKIRYCEENGLKSID